jgi:hypothetical protein
VAHACNPSYSGGQEDQVSKKQFVRPYLEKILHKERAGEVAQGEGPEFKPPYHQKKKKRILGSLLEVLFNFSSVNIH